MDLWLQTLTWLLPTKWSGFIVNSAIKTSGIMKCRSETRDVLSSSYLYKKVWSKGKYLLFRTSLENQPAAKKLFFVLQCLNPVSFWLNGTVTQGQCEALTGFVSTLLAQGAVPWWVYSKPARLESGLQLPVHSESLVHDSALRDSNTQELTGV